MPEPSVATHFRNALAFALGRICPPDKRLPAAARHELESGKIRKIIFVRAQQGIGDFLLATPLLRAFQERYPSVQLHVLASRHNAAAVTDSTRLAKLWIWDKKLLWNPFRLFPFWFALRDEKFDIAVALASNTPSFTSLLVSRLMGAQATWSYDTTTFYGGTNWSRYLANVEISLPPTDAPEYQKFSHLVQDLVPVSNLAPEFFVSATDEAAIAAIWPSLKAEGMKTVGIFLGGNASRMDRLWLPGAWAELVRLLHASRIHVIAICPPKNLRAGGGARESDFYAEFRAALGRDVPVFDQKGLGKAAALIRRFDLFICPDGGLFHVGCAAGAETLGLFFGTDPERWRPPVPWAHVLSAPGGQSSQLSPARVAEFVKERLSAGAPALQRIE